MSGLPEGFTIDQPAAKGGLPEGFTIDEKGTGTKIADAIRSVRDAVHAPTRALENGYFMGQADRIRAGMDSMMGQGSYGANLASEQGETAQFAKDHPVASPALEMAGASAGPLAISAKAIQGIPKALQGLSPADQALIAQLGGAAKYAAPVAEAATSALVGPGPGMIAKGGKLAYDMAVKGAKGLLPGYGAYELLQMIRGK